MYIYIIIYIMGKRKRRSDQNKTPHSPAFMPYSPQMDSVSKEKSSHPVGTSAVKPMSSLMDIMESSTKLPNSHHSHAHRHHNLNRALLLKLPRHYYSLQYSQRNSFNHASSITTSHGKSIPSRDDKLSLKLAHKSESEYAPHAEKREKAWCRPDRIRSSSLVVETVSPNVMKMLCGLCQKMLRIKPCILETTISSNDLSVVAVLVCGHAYHADCLETKTCYADRRDPPCPLCVNPAARS